MNTEKKTYSIVGKVEIGTDEYRDLIEGLAEAKADADKSNSERWKEYSRANKAESELKAIKERFTALDAFVKSDEALMTKFKLFQIERMNGTQEGAT